MIGWQKQRKTVVAAACALLELVDAADAHTRKYVVTMPGSPGVQVDAGKQARQ